MADSATAPFASVTSSLAPDGTTPQEFDLQMSSHDMVLVVQPVTNDGSAAVRLLHLKNVREDTLTEAQIAINSFFDQFEPLDNDNSSPGNTAFQMYDRVYKDTKENIQRALREVEEVKVELVEVQYNESLYPKRLADTSGENFNPVAEVIAACNDFLKQVRSIQSRALAYSQESRPRRYARIVSKGGDSNHEPLEAYIKKTSAERNLGCNWYPQYYPGLLDDEDGVQYRVHFDQNEGWVFEYLYQ